MEELFSQCLHRVRCRTGFGLGLQMKGAKSEECDNREDFRNTRHIDKLGISFLTDKREDLERDWRMGEVKFEDYELREQVNLCQFHDKTEIGS